MVTTKHPNFFIDTSAYNTDRYPAQLVEFMRHHGSHKVLFGSNYPMITPAKALAGLDALRLDDIATPVSQCQCPEGVWVRLVTA